VIIPILLSWSNIVGHVKEIVTPYQGTIDVTIAYIRSHFTNPSKLVIATNYEEHVYMYYLKSRVIIGQALNNLPEDTKYQPDIIIPRQFSHFKAYPYFDAFRRNANYQEMKFPIRDFPVNNIPELRHPIFYHQFSTLKVGRGSPYKIFVRSQVANY
jgi:hypothetical protein